MARSIGTLGVSRAPTDLDFDYFGATIRVHPDASDTVELEFMEVGKDIDLSDLQGKDVAELDEKTQAVLTRANRALVTGYGLVRSSLQQVIHPDDWDTFWQTARANRQRIGDLMTVLKRVTAAVVEADTGFPTLPPSGSPAGPESIPASSAAGSSWAAAGQSSDADQALKMLRGRPDLQEFVVLQEEADTAKAAQPATNGRQTAAQKLLAARGQG